MDTVLEERSHLESLALHWIFCAVGRIRHLVECHNLCYSRRAVSAYSRAHVTHMMDYKHLSRTSTLAATCLFPREISAYFLCGPSAGVYIPRLEASSEGHCTLRGRPITRTAANRIGTHVWPPNLRPLHNTASPLYCLDLVDSRPGE